MTNSIVMASSSISVRFGSNLGVIRKLESESENNWNKSKQINSTGNLLLPGVRLRRAFRTFRRVLDDSLEDQALVSII